jgi:hypothetical protein
LYTLAAEGRKTANNVKSGRKVFHLWLSFNLNSLFDLEMDGKYKNTANELCKRKGPFMKKVKEV